MTNNTHGTITADHAKEIEQVFGERGKEIAKQLAENPKATFLSLLFKNRNQNDEISSI